MPHTRFRNIHGHRPFSRHSRTYEVHLFNHMVGLIVPVPFLGNLYRCRISSFVPVRPSDIRALSHLPESVILMEGIYLIRIMSPHHRSTGVSERIPVRSKHHVYMQQSLAVYESPTATRTIIWIYHRSIAGIALPGYGTVCLIGGPIWVRYRY